MGAAALVPACHTFTVTVDGLPQTYSVRTVPLNGSTWTLAADICPALGFVNVAKSMKYLRADEQALVPVRGFRGQRAIVIAESGLNRLLLRSSKPVAHAFQDWVCRGVLPMVRREGRYQDGGEGREAAVWWPMGPGMFAAQM